MITIAQGYVNNKQGWNLKIRKNLSNYNVLLTIFYRKGAM